ncbi:MAG: class I SAM-dependent methyltransferase [Ruminococcaceae bacterium]|nr:class I SAM-dependent methyltransferase [Oscillospiraceae bacterium]
MTDNYFALSKVYDILNADLDYGAWADYIDGKIKTHSDIDVSLVLDLCCGTGTMTMELDKRGYDMTGIDLSPDMLEIARAKAQEAGRAENILFLCQDMCSFELYGTVQAVVSCLDSLNHLDSKADLKKVFDLVHNYLEPGGLFIFDLNSPYKFKNIYGTNAYVLEDEGIYCGWQNIYDKESRICDFYTSVFTENEDGTYSRFDDYEREYCFTLREVEKLLEKCGFEVVCVDGDTDGSPVEKDTERFYFTAKRK